MADVQQQLQHSQTDVNQSTTLSSNTSALPTPALEDRPPKRRASLSPVEKQLAAATSGTRNMDAQKKSRNVSSYKGNNVNSRGSVMTMPGMIGGEITYTPTTHRISKAKKGKKVHACEFPGCTKIFTRAEHRKRHEANHNTSPAFQCQIEGCKKPFQRADLLTRHMERQHNMPSDPSTRSQYSRSAHSASPCMSHIGAAHMRQAPSSTPSSLPQPGGAMSIGSIIEQNQFHSSAYRSHSLPLGDMSDMSSDAPIGTGPRSLHQDMLYGLTSSGDSPLYSSSDSCYSPISDYLQPQAPMGPYYGQEIQRPATVSVESSYQPLVHSPMTHSPASMGPATPSWGQTFDPVTLGFVNDAPYVPSVCPSDETEDIPEYQTYDVEQHRQYQYSSPSWTNATTIPQYEMAMPQNQQWPWTKVSY